MKIWTKIEWAIIAAAMVLLLLLLILFSYNHPHSDDFSYTSFVMEKGFWEANQYIFNTNAGRFVSSSLQYMNPMKSGKIGGYHAYTAGMFLVFVLSLFFFLRIIFDRFVPTKSSIFLFAFLFLTSLSFLPNLHEFCFWLCGEATYLAAITLWLWAVILHIFWHKEKHADNKLIWIGTTLLAIAIAGCSEAGIFLYTLVLFISFIYRKQKKSFSSKGFYLHSALFFLVVLFVLMAPGNIIRHQYTPFSGGFLLAISGGFYAAGFWLSKWAIIFMPVVCFYILIFGHRLKQWAAEISRFRLLKAKTVFVGSLLFFLICQIVMVWMSGSTPEPRVENLFFLFLLMAFLLAAQLMMHEQAELFDMLKGKIHRGFKTLSFIYLACIFMVVPNNAVNALLDVISGNAAAFDQENKERYRFLQEITDETVMVKNIKHQPALLYFQTVSCNPEPDKYDIPRIALADYFGKKWIYEYPCSPVQAEYSIKEILKEKRQQFFQKKEK